jgi:hypothetical protein
MKKSALLIVVAMMLAAQVAKSQNFIAVQNGGAPAFYLQVDDAILNSQDGDTIYIPGGTWNLNQPINKRLHIIGVGHHPDSTNATFPTKLIGILSLAEGSSSGSLTGIFLQGYVFVPNSPVNSYLVQRCNLSGGVFFNQSQCTFTFIENIIGSSIGVSGGSASNCSFINNIISAYFYKSPDTPFTNSVFKNNIFLAQTYCSGYCEYCIACSFSLLENNIFYGYYGSYSTLPGVSNSTFKNNLFVEGNPFPNYSTNIGTDNIVGQDQNSIFINQYPGDYHLQPTCPGKNAGTDGTDIGIYGGIYPWKDGSIPSNPHFQSVNVAPVADSAGNLNVNIKVAAQDR